MRKKVRSARQYMKHNIAVLVVGTSHSGPATKRYSLTKGPLTSFCPALLPPTLATPLVPR